ncbi:MAG: NTP transferase domain-containing protein [Nakamurella sp.]
MSRDHDRHADRRPAATAGIVLAGGAGRRLGGVDKPGLIIAGSTLLDRALVALGDTPVVVVGTRRRTGRPVTFVVEDPPGSGPAAAVRAGVTALRTLDDDTVIVLLAADLPAVSSDTVDRLVNGLARAAADPDADDTDGAVLLDRGNQEQLLLGVWRIGSLRRACAQRSSWTDVPLRQLLAPLRRVAVPELDDEAADIDTPEQWRRWSDR